MNNINIVKDFFQSIENQNFTRAESLMSQSFTFKGATPEPQNKEDFLTAHRSMLNAMSNFHYNVEDLEGTGNKVTASVQLEGKHTGEFDLSFMDGPTAEATNKTFRLPREPITLNIENDKITRLEVARVEGGGMEGILKILGVKMPEPQA